jgi:hypothetical protein
MVYKNMDGLLYTVKRFHRMSVDIIKFPAAVQKWFVKCGLCNIIDFTTVLECNKN